jgi:hypothetical protein
MLEIGFKTSDLGLKYKSGTSLKKWPCQPTEPFSKYINIG